MNDDPSIFFKLLQLSMSPVVLISAAALLLLSLTNRLGRTVDRARFLASELEGPTPASKDSSRVQLAILLQRCRLLRMSVTFAAASILFSSLLILSLTFFLFAAWPLKSLALVLFLAIILSLVGSILYFLVDVSVSLKAVKVDVAPHL
jgi:hypothetical protein